MMENVSAGMRMQQQSRVVLHMLNCYSLAWCYTRFVARLLFFKMFQEKLCILSVSSKGSIWLFTPVLQRFFPVPCDIVFEKTVVMPLREGLYWIVRKLSGVLSFYQ